MTDWRKLVASLPIRTDLEVVLELLLRASSDLNVISLGLENKSTVDSRLKTWSQGPIDQAITLLRRVIEDATGASDGHLPG